MIPLCLCSLVLRVAYTIQRVKRRKRNRELSKRKIIGLLVALVVLGIVMAIGAVVENTAEQSPAAVEDTPVAETTATAAPEAADPSPTTTGTEPATADPQVADPETPTPITVENDEDFAEVMFAARDSELYGAFAVEHEGQEIQFDGVVAAIAPHGGYDTRFDILVFGGDSIDTGVTSPNFQFNDVSIVSDLNLTGANIPDTLAAGQKVRVTAVIDRYDPEVTDLFYLEPVSTEIRQ